MCGTTKLLASIRCSSKQTANRSVSPETPMPELPEVEAIREKIAPEITGRRITGVHVARAVVIRPQRASTIAKLAAGRKIEAVNRRGKNILVGLSGGYVIRVHLRMTGELKVAREGGNARVWFDLTGGRKLVFEDTRALGRVNVLTEAEVRKALAKLGPEPLSADFALERFTEEAARSRRPAKLFLMDQTHVAGLGNIYAAEALFRARLDPRKPMSETPRAKVAALHSTIVEVLREAMKSARIAYNRPGKFQEGEEFISGVYGREGEACPVCGHKIRRIEQGGRSTYFCPHCQR
jgi:formamidopyrimidine-DNA glycosylase